MNKRHLLVATCISIMSLSMPTFACKACGCSMGTQGNSLSFIIGGGEDFFSSKRHIKNPSVPFVAVDYNFTCQWGIEALVGFFNTTFTGDFDNGTQTNGNLVLIDGIFRFSPYHFVQPYLLAGVGITSLSSNRTDANNQGNINAGVGVQFRVNEVVSFRADVRDLYTLVGGKNDVFVGAGVVFDWNIC